MTSKVFAAAAFMLVLPFFVSAQGIFATQPPITNDLNRVFSVSLEKVSLVPSGGDEYQADFSLSGAKGFSSPLSYVLALKQKYGTAMFAYYGSHNSEKEFSITSGAEVSFKDSFSIPPYVSGAQDLYLVLLTADGVPLQEFLLGEVIGSENESPVVGFDFNDCYISFSDLDHKASDQEMTLSPKMPIGGFIGRFAKDITRVHCGVIFENASPATYSVGFRAHRTTTHGPILKEGIMEKAMTFARGESNVIDIPISDFGEEGRVEAELFLVDGLNKKQVTPPLTLSYDIPGESRGSIGGAFINSDSFKKGDEIGIFVLSSLVTQNYRTVRLDVRDANGGICADMQLPASDIGTLITTMSQSDCTSPVVAVTLLNKDSVEIDRLDFTYPSKLPEKTASSEVSAIISILLAALFILLLAAFLIFAAKKHLNKRSSILPLMIFIFSFLANLVFPSVINAQTLPGGYCGYEYTTPGTYTLSVPSNVNQATVSGSGGGAGGAGGSWDSDFSSPGNGGGGGAAAVSGLTLAVIQNSKYTVIVGDGGVGGTGNWNIFGGNPVGTAGGTSSISTLISLPGGDTAYWGGDYFNAGGSAGGAGGQVGGWGYRDCGGTGGKGGDSLFGQGGAATYGVSIPGSNGTGYGAGGSGASGGCGGGAPDGGNGSSGFIRVEWTCPGPTVDLKINGSNGSISVSQGATKNITWTTTNATSCTASSNDGFAGTKVSVSPPILPPNGGETLTANVTSNHTLMCTNASGSAADSVQVNVTVPPPPPPPCTCGDTKRVCAGQPFNDSCGSKTCTGTRSCDYNWKEVAP